MTLEEFLQGLHAVRRSAAGYVARCPAHDDHVPSLSVTEKDRRILVYCHAGCAPERIVSALGFTMADLRRHEQVGPVRTETVTYDYRDETGRLLSQVVRYEPKSFRQRRPDERGGWVWSLDGVRRVVYRLPDLIAEMGRRSPGQDSTVFVAEGEKDADSLRGKGLAATTNLGGAGKWREEDTTQLRAAGVDAVVVLPDNDPQGDRHALAVARSCLARGIRVRIVRLPNLPTKGDVSDWFREGHTAAELLELVAVTPQLRVEDLRPEPNSFPPFKGGDGNETNLRPLAAADFLAAEPAAITWVWERFLPVGSLALLVAYMKVGKSTLVYALAVAVARGRPFLGYPTERGGVLILAVEEHPRDVRRRLERFGLRPTDPLFVHAGRLDPTAATFSALRELILERGIRLVILDTLARFWNPSDENSNSEVVRCLSPLLDLARDTGATILLVHHERKTGGEAGRAIRGGSALFGLVDQALMLDRRPGGDAAQRMLRALGRYEETPSELIVALHGDEWQALGTPADVDLEASKAKVWEALTEEPRDIRALADETGLKEKQTRRALEALGALVIREGKGRKGDPHTFRRAASDSIRSRPHPIEKESNPPGDQRTGEAPGQPRPDPVAARSDGNVHHDDAQEEEWR